jgi:HAE1 family hydrophobic/amphiphilic exporter-1
VVNPLARIPGVGTVSISGAPQREIQVYCDPYKLEAYNLSIETISSIIGAENKNIPGGNFDIGNETYSLRVEGEFPVNWRMWWWVPITVLPFTCAT